METKTVEITEAQASLPELVSLATAGVEVVLTKDRIPVASIVPMKSTAGERIPGLHAGAFKVGDDFDQPLPDEFWMGQA
jgi:antitoxin (DNA-binding transcriptional repressor) of toxin-antitoxin stability system